jgi:putative restriction endonuclease
MVGPPPSTGTEVLAWTASAEIPLAITNETLVFATFARYGNCCIACEMRQDRILQAAHIIPVDEGGSDDPRNGLVLCANHHRAFDSRLFRIDPVTLAIVPNDDGPTLADLEITKTNLSALSRKPHEVALKWRWEKSGKGHSIL